MPNERIGCHFTHIDNVEEVLNQLAMMCDSSVSAGGLLVTETADTDLKAERRQTPVGVRPGGVLADYVPFYFHPLSPMLYRVATGYEVDYDGGQAPLVFFIVDVARLVSLGHQLVISDGHPVAAVSSFADVSQLETHVDWSIMTGKYWFNTDADGDRKRRRQAELLVHFSVPLDHVAGLVCKTRETKEQLDDLLDAAGLSITTRVRPDFYYPNIP